MCIYIYMVYDGIVNYFHSLTCFTHYSGNQGFICLDENPNTKSDAVTTEKRKVTKDKSVCAGTPMMYIHDVGGTLGYGWNLQHKNFWPNYMDLQQVLCVCVCV